MSDGKWPIWKLSILLYPFAAGAVAINFFMLLLMLQAIGFTAVSPSQSLIWGLVLGVPAAWASGKWARRMMDEADT